MISKAYEQWDTQHGSVSHVLWYVQLSCHENKPWKTPLAHTHRWAMGCRLWVFWRKTTILSQDCSGWLHIVHILPVHKLCILPCLFSVVSSKQSLQDSGEWRGNEKVPRNCRRSQSTNGRYGECLECVCKERLTHWPLGNLNEILDM